MRERFKSSHSSFDSVAVTKRRTEDVLDRPIPKWLATQDVPCELAVQEWPSNNSHRQRSSQITKTLARCREGFGFAFAKCSPRKLGESTGNSDFQLRCYFWAVAFRSYWNFDYGRASCVTVSKLPPSPSNKLWLSTRRPCTGGDEGSTEAYGHNRAISHLRYQHLGRASSSSVVQRVREHFTCTCRQERRRAQGGKTTILRARESTSVFIPVENVRP